MQEKGARALRPDLGPPPFPKGRALLKTLTCLAACIHSPRSR